MDIRIDIKNKWVVFYLEGRLDVKLSQDLEAMVMNYINDGQNFILFNLKDVEYMSSSGLRVLISTMRKLKEVNGEIRLSNMSQSVKKILKIVNLENMFNIYPNEKEALS